MYADGINCRPETAVSEFAEVRAKYGKQGAMRKAPAVYELPAEGEEATHVRRTYPSGRKYWALAEDGEQATHVRREGVAYEPAGRAVATHKRVGKRWVETSVGATHVSVEGGYARETEAINLIYSFDLSSVNPDNPADTEQGFEFARADIERKFSTADGGCAVQAQLVGQADGKGRQFHVHVTLNPYLIEDAVTPDGGVLPAGRKLNAQLTDIDWIRDSSNALAVERPELGFDPQPKDAAARAADKRGSMDRRMEAQGQQSNHDFIRSAYETSMEDPRVMDLQTFREVMRDDHEVTVTLRGKKKPTLSYKLPSMPQAVRGGDRTKQLGSHYSYESTMSQLEAKAAGLPRQKRPAPVPQLPPRPDPVITEQQHRDGMHTIDLLVAQEHRERVQDWAEERAAERAQSVNEILARLPQSPDAQYRAVQVWGAIKSAADDREAELDAWIQDWARDEGLTLAEFAVSYGYHLNDPQDRSALRSVMKQQQAQVQPEPSVTPAPNPEVETALPHGDAGTTGTRLPTAATMPAVEVSSPKKPPTAKEMMKTVREGRKKYDAGKKELLAELQSRHVSSSEKVPAETPDEYKTEAPPVERPPHPARVEVEVDAEPAPEATVKEPEMEAIAPDPVQLPKPDKGSDVEAKPAAAAERRRLQDLAVLDRQVASLDETQPDRDYGD